MSCQEIQIIYNKLYYTLIKAQVIDKDIHVQCDSKSNSCVNIILVSYHKYNYSKHVMSGDTDIINYNILKDHSINAIVSIVI